MRIIKKETQSPDDAEEEEEEDDNRGFDVYLPRNRSRNGTATLKQYQFYDVA